MISQGDTILVASTVLSITSIGKLAVKLLKPNDDRAIFTAQPCTELAILALLNLTLQILNHTQRGTMHEQHGIDASRSRLNLSLKTLEGLMGWQATGGNLN
jgi:hypothetical protein